ncbi:MAG: VIT domain-containing protein, partial [Gammaproteobacteria bacterium]
MRTATSHAPGYGPTYTGAPGPQAGLVAVDGRSYPLRRVRIRATAHNGIAESRLEQQFDNPYDEALEVSYTLALPADGAVIGYTVTAGETVIRGQIETRLDATKAYRQALIEGRTAGLLEQERADTFSQFLGAIPAHTPIRVEIRIAHPLGFTPTTGRTSATWEYRFPTVAGVRYMGAPGRVPDAEKLDPERADAAGTPARLELELSLAGEDTPTVSSPSHDVTVEPAASGVVARTAAAALDRDVIVRWAACGTGVGVRMVEGGGLDGDTGRYALLTLTPPDNSAQKRPRDLSLLIDASGSMHGTPLECARELAIRVLRTLDEQDRFELSAFSTDVRTLAPARTPASEGNVKNAIRALRSLDAGGGTEMAHAIEAAMVRGCDEAQRQIVLITDGYIGFEEEVIRKAYGTQTGSLQIHAVGVGSAPNRTLLRGLARAGRGAELLVGNTDDIESAGETLLKATCAPVLIEIDIGGTALAAPIPGALRDVMAGQPLRALLELAHEGGELTIEGALTGQCARWSSVLHVPGAGGEMSTDTTALDGETSVRRTNLPLGAMYGREAADDVEARRAIAEDDYEIEQLDIELERLGLKHRIVTRRTSMVAVAEHATVDPRAPRRQIRLALEVPAEVSAAAAGLRPRLRSQANAFEVCATAPAAYADLPSAGMAGEIKRAYIERSRGPRPSSKPAFSRRPVSASRRRRNTVTATVLDVRGAWLLIEFRVPSAGLNLERHRDASNRVLRIRSLHDAFLGRASIDESATSPLQRYDEGVIVRLALQLEGQSEWPAAP